MMDKAVRFQTASCSHAHRAVATDATEVVTQQINDHDVLGAVLLAAQQFLDLRLILGWRGAADGGDRR